MLCHNNKYVRNESPSSRLQRAEGGDVKQQLQGLNGPSLLFEKSVVPDCRGKERPPESGEREVIKDGEATFD